MTTKDVVVLGDRLREDAAALVATMEALGPDAPHMSFDGGMRIPSDRAPGTFLGELVIHGYDVAQTTGRPWTIEPSHIPMIMDGLPALTGQVIIWGPRPWLAPA